jgi:hypothetical protein
MSDLATIDGLARLQLTARRLGLELRLCGVAAELSELIGFLGLTDALGVEPGGQSEEREQRLGVEEEAELGDAPV